MKHFITVQLLVAIAILLLSSASQIRATDLDEDGLDDALEQMLIDRHRPHLYYDGNEDTWPSSVLCFVQHSELIHGTDTNVLVSRSQLEANPLRLLQGSWGQQVSSMIGTPEKTGFRCNIFNGFRSGQGPQPVGTYAHVVPLTGPVDYSNRPPLPTGPDDLLIQYWQFFPYNDSQAPLDIGDHEGDWLYLDVIVTRAPPHTLRFVAYHHHGDGNCHPDILPIHAPLPDDGIPKCYLDEGSHEWWPWACADDDCHDCFGADPHDGTGPNYRAENILNLGERYAPMPGIEPQLILFFNGTWGWQAGIEAEPPHGPINQYYPFAPLIVGYLDRSAPVWPLQGIGSRYHPFRSLSQARDKVSAEIETFRAHGTSGRLLIKAATYSGDYTFDRPMSLEVWGTGTVTIGQ